MLGNNLFSHVQIDWQRYKKNFWKTTWYFQTMRRVIYMFALSILDQYLQTWSPWDERGKILFKSLHILRKMTSWAVNLLPISVGPFNLQLHLIPILSFLPCWSNYPLLESRPKLLNLCHVILIRSHSSSLWMSRSWICWTSKIKSKLGLKFLTTSIHFSQMYSSCPFFQTMYWII